MAGRAAVVFVLGSELVGRARSRDLSGSDGWLSRRFRSASLARLMVGAAAALLGGLACGPSVVRTGPPIQLPSGEPRNACESQEWVELAPARLDAQAATALPIVTVHHFQQFYGPAIFRAGTKDPQDLQDV